MSAHFESRKWAYRQTKEGTVISFLVHPNDISTEMATAPLGTRYMVAFAQIGDDEQPTEQPKPERPRQPWSSMSYAQRSGILRNDLRFMEWIGATTAESGAEFIRKKCGVDSCSKIDGDKHAIERFDKMDYQFRVATGQIAEAR
jgi:hypothetical protein